MEGRTIIAQGPEHARVIFQWFKDMKNFTNSAHSRDFYHLPYICGLFMCTVFVMER
jgi:hypothetical protein